MKSLAKAETMSACLDKHGRVSLNAKLDYEWLGFTLALPDLRCGECAPLPLPRLSLLARSQTAVRQYFYHHGPKYHYSGRNVERETTAFGEPAMSAKGDEGRDI